MPKNVTRMPACLMMTCISIERILFCIDEANSTPFYLSLKFKSLTVQHDTQNFRSFSSNYLPIIFVMVRSSVIRAVIAIGARSFFKVCTLYLSVELLPNIEYNLQPVQQHAARIIAQPRSFLSAPAVTQTFVSEHIRCFNSANALSKRHEKPEPKYRRGCGEKRRRRKRRCDMNVELVCLKDVHKHSKKHSSKCCPCKKPKTMDPYRRQ